MACSMSCVIRTIIPPPKFTIQLPTRLLLPYALTHVDSTLIDISQLDFAYGSRLALKHISLSVSSGTTLGVIGPNGGGKTTLIKLMLGLLEPTRGTIRIAGLTPGQAARRGDVIGYLPQARPVATRFPLTALQLVRLGLAGKTGFLQSYDPADLLHIDWLMARMGMTELADAPIASLSGGQLQRVLIARALAARPAVLLLDEPTTGVDRSGQDQFVQFIAELKRELNLTVVLVSHDMHTVSHVCDRIACLNVKLHYHDVPQQLPAGVAMQLFGCNVEAMGLGGHA